MSAVFTELLDTELLEITFQINEISTRFRPQFPNIKRPQIPIYCTFQSPVTF